MNGKKGQNLSINTIIITILAIFVLVILVVALTGGTGSFVDWWNKIFQSSAIDTQTAVLQCNGLCTSYDSTGADKFRIEFCEREFDIDTTGDKKADLHLTCPEMSQVSCSSIEC